MIETLNLAELDAEWRRREPKAMRDGILSPDLYRKAKIRILFVLKEPSHKGAGDDLLGWLRKRGEPKQNFGPTWKPVARWAKTILGLSDERTALHQVAAINLRKAPGGAKADAHRITRTAQRDRDLLRRQVELIDPQVIIGAGTGDSLCWIFDLNPYGFVENREGIRHHHDGRYHWLMTRHPNRSAFEYGQALATLIPM